MKKESGSGTKACMQTAGPSGTDESTGRELSQKAGKNLRREARKNWAPGGEDISIFDEIRSREKKQMRGTAEENTNERGLLRRPSQTSSKEDGKTGKRKKRDYTLVGRKLSISVSGGSRKPRPVKGHQGAWRA